jgi:Na+-transporting methylmalonyl-CoA/oxaloacetate decarboxylase gamma subunit
MQRLLVFLVIIILTASITWMAKAQQKTPEKKYEVKQTIDWWQHTLNVMEAAKTQLKQSDLPSKNVVYLTDSLLAPIQMEMTKQIQDQLNAERAAQQKKDTSNKIKNK